MQHFHDEVRMEAPVEQVWAFFLDTSHWAAWMPRRRTSDLSGPLDRVGTTYVQSTQFMGHEMTWTNEVVEVEPLRLIHVHSDYGPIDSYFRFEPDGEATHLVVDSDYAMPARMTGFLEDLMRTGWMERTVRRMFHDVIERPWAEPW